jgi:hypothetical protein
MLADLSELSYNVFMDKDVELERMQKVIGASDEEVAVKAKFSSKTFQRAKKGLCPPETRAAFVEALDTLRAEINRQTSKPFKARTAG